MGQNLRLCFLLMLVEWSAKRLRRFDDDEEAGNHRRENVNVPRPKPVHFSCVMKDLWSIFATLWEHDGQFQGSVVAILCRCRLNGNTECGPLLECTDMRPKVGEFEDPSTTIAPTSDSRRCTVCDCTRRIQPSIPVSTKRSYQAPAMDDPPSRYKNCRDVEAALIKASEEARQLEMQLIDDRQNMYERERRLTRCRNDRYRNQATAANVERCELELKQADEALASRVKLIHQMHKDNAALPEDQPVFWKYKTKSQEEVWRVMQWKLKKLMDENEEEQEDRSYENVEEGEKSESYEEFDTEEDDVSQSYVKVENEDANEEG